MKDNAEKIILAPTTHLCTNAYYKIQTNTLDKITDKQTSSLGEASQFDSMKTLKANC